MIRKTFRVLLAAFIAVVVFASLADAAPAKKSVRHRQRHSSRVTAGAEATTGTSTKKTTKRKKKTSRSHSHASTSTTSKKRHPSTKPR